MRQPAERHRTGAAYGVPLPPGRPRESGGVSAVTLGGWRTRGECGMDGLLVWLLGALAVSVALFLTDVFPYPFGLLVLSTLAIARYLATRGGSS